MESAKLSKSKKFRKIKGGDINKKLREIIKLTEPVSRDPK